MTLVIDESVVAAFLLGDGEDGLWAADLVGREDLRAPHFMPAEVTNVLRRAYLSGSIDQVAASLAITDLLGIRVDFMPFAPFALRAWELHATVTAYDAWYVALAEELDVPLATLDRRLAASPGPRCEFLLPS